MATTVFGPVRVEVTQAWFGWPFFDQDGVEVLGGSYLDVGDKGPGYYPHVTIFVSVDGEEREYPIGHDTRFFEAGGNSDEGLGKVAEYWVPFALAILEGFFDPLRFNFMTVEEFLRQQLGQRRVYGALRFVLCGKTVGDVLGEKYGWTLIKEPQTIGD